MSDDKQKVLKMIQEYSAYFATQMGIELSNVSLSGGNALGCYEAFILSFDSDGKLVSEFIHQSDLDSLRSGSGCEWLELKVKAALSRLKMLLEP
jgi:hypothetical protein